MKKKLTAFLALLMLCFSLNITVFAAQGTQYIADELDVMSPQKESDLNAYADYLAGETGVDFIFVTTGQTENLADYSSRLVDNADLVLDTEEATLLKKLDEISERQQLDVVVVTVESVGDKTPEAYADDFYDYNGYGFGENHDGILLLVSMENRDWHITTTGYGITVFTDAGIKYLSKQFLDDLSDGNYAAAFTTYAEKCDEFITQAKTGEPYDVNNLPKEPFDFLMWILISVVVGLVAAYVITKIMKGKLKTVRFQPAASNYVKQGSFNLTNSRDIFLYTHVDRRPRPKDTSSGGSRSGGSSTHTSSSGSTHGGGGGKF